MDKWRIWVVVRRRNVIYEINYCLFIMKLFYIRKVNKLEEVSEEDIRMAL